MKSEILSADCVKCPELLIKIWWEKKVLYTYTFASLFALGAMASFWRD